MSVIPALPKMLADAPAEVSPPAAGRHHRRRWVGIALHSFFGFMAFNATVVFAMGVVRWLGLGVCLGLGGLWWLKGTRSRRKVGA